jgi:DNA-binding PucR family transcriptional regulator
VVDRLRARHAEIARAIHDRIEEAVPTAVGERDPSYREGVLAAIDAVLSYSLEVIERAPGWSGPIPAEATAQARHAASAGVGLGTVLRRYVAGHGRLGEFVAEETAQIGLASDAPELQHISRTHDALLGHLTAAIEQEHDQERRRMMRLPGQRRVELVRRLLDGESVSRMELADLGYKLDAWHVGVIVMGANAREALESLKADRQLLPVTRSEETVWAWLGGQRRLAQTDMDRLRLDGELVGLALAVGEPARGIEGWRQTHRQARQALQVALLTPQTRARYADVALLTPWLEDPVRARAFVDLYLLALEDQKDGGAMLRHTLRVYLEAARNVSAAARELYIDRRTLTHRLATIETCVGYKLDSRKAELEVALRLYDLLERQELRKPVQNPTIGFPTLA